MLGTEAPRILVQIELHRRPLRKRIHTLRQVLFVDVYLAAPQTSGRMVDRSVGAEPTEMLLPLKDVSHQRLVRNPLRPLRFDICALFLPDPAGVSPIALAAALLGVSLAPAFWPVGLGDEVGVGQDLLKGDFSRALLSLLLRGADLPGPCSAGPLPGKGRELDRSLVAACDLLRLVDSLPLVQIALRYLHAQGIQLGLRRDRRVLAQFCLSGTLLRQLLGSQLLVDFSPAFLIVLLGELFYCRRICHQGLMGR
mmetsp:Transcript_118111/g.338825  ORF Transcript_118111/g.338825 Transcript_118111/m.338825 type:complete len:253 (+) Transcript_118111:108-866(+)